MSARTATSTAEAGASAGGPRASVPSEASTSALLARAHVAVLAGGRSSEREVSLVTALAVREALQNDGAGGDHGDGGDRRGPARVSAVELRPDGRWAVGERELSPAHALAELADVDVFFLALHGGEGEGGTIQGLLAAEGRRFTGSDVRASAVSLDKVFCRDLAAQAGMRVPRGKAVDAEEWAADPGGIVAELQAWERAVEGWVVKPRCGGSSVGTVLVRRGEGSAAQLAGALESALAEAFRWEDEALVEELVTGVETTGGVLEDHAGRPRALEPIEIRPHEGRFFDYDEKYSEGGARELCPPESLEPQTCARVRELSLRAHGLLRCAGYSRSDFIVPFDREGRPAGEPVFLELNTLPGLTPRSLLPRACAVDGLGYRDLCLAILAAALREPARSEAGGASS